MAKIKINDKEVKVKDGDSITEGCEALGISFGCYVGTCGICQIKVIEGMNNLSEITENEKNWNLGSDVRLACQCKIKEGEIRIKK